MKEDRKQEAILKIFKKALKIMNGAKIDIIYAIRQTPNQEIKEISEQLSEEIPNINWSADKSLLLNYAIKFKAPANSQLKEGMAGRDYLMEKSRKPLVKTAIILWGFEREYNNR